MRSGKWAPEHGGLSASLKAAAVAAPIVAASAVGATELRIAIGNPATHAHVYGYDRYAEFLDENAEVNPTIYHLSLLSLSEIPDGLRDGIAGMGAVITAYKPAEYAEMNLIANLSMLATSGEEIALPAAAMSGAVMEYVLLHCPDCLNQFASLNQVFLGSVSTSPYMLLCTQPVQTLEEMRGKRFRSGAANFTRWAESVGGVAVSIPGNEIYDAMSQGVVDCSMLTIGDLLGAGLLDVTRAVHRGVPGGLFAGIAINAVNRNLWSQLSVEDRETFLRGTADLVADIVIRQRELELEATEIAQEQGLTISDADEATLEHYAAFVEGDMSVIATEFENQYRLSNTEEKLEIAQGLIERWVGLAAEVGEDRDALAQLYWDEILSHVDVSTFGLN